MTDWQERAEAIRRRREAKGLPLGRADLKSAIREAVRDLDDAEGTARDYNPNVGFDYAEDVAAYPFGWRPTEPVRVSLSAPTVCPCDSLVRTLKKTVQAKPRFCAECLTPDDVERRKPSEYATRCDPVRVAAMYLPGLADALDSVQIPKPKTRGRAYTIDQKREAVRLYRAGGITQAEIAAKLGVTLPSVKNWIHRYGEDPYFVPAA